MDPILLYDTTLRDGTQGENITFSAPIHLQGQLTKIVEQVYFQGNVGGVIELPCGRCLESVYDTFVVPMRVVYLPPSSQAAASGAALLGRRAEDKSPSRAQAAATAALHRCCDPLGCATSSRAMSSACRLVPGTVCDWPRGTLRPNGRRTA